MKLDQQIKTVISAIDELKGENITTIKVAKKTSDMEAIIITTSRSNQHSRGIANNVKIEAKYHKMMVLGIEGTDLGEWILLDLGEVVVHIMTSATRDFYQLEDLWTGSKK